MPEHPSTSRDPASEPSIGSFDRWSPASDVMVETLGAQQQRLERSRRTDRVLAVILTGCLVWLIAVTRSMVWASASFMAALLAAALYVPLRGGPRQRALNELEARLEVVDPHCPTCRYALRHLLTARCPECGRRVKLPSLAEVENVVAGGQVNVARGSVGSDLGWIVLLVMVLTATVTGRLFGFRIGLDAMSVPPSVFLVTLAVRRRRLARRVPSYAICDACGESTSLAESRCAHCAAVLLADHVFVRPGARGDFDRRLHCTWAQLLGGACACAMLPVVALSASTRGTSGDPEWHGGLWLGVQFVLAVAALGILRIDLRRRSSERLAKYDRAFKPLCPRCLAPLAGQPAAGSCPQCRYRYRAIELAGGG